MSQARNDGLDAMLYAQKAMASVETPTATLDMLESMDMDVFASQEEPAEPHGWRITDDGCADWAVQKIAEERAELERIKELAYDQIARIEYKIAAAEKRCENSTRFLTSKLSEYFTTVPRKSTKTKSTYRLLSGILTLKHGGPVMSQNDDKLVEYLKASGQTEYIKVKESPKWGEFKKRLEIVGGAVVDRESGEIVDGVQVIEKPDIFTVDL